MLTDTPILTRRVKVVPVRIEWLCETDGCAGQMKYEGDMIKAGSSVLAKGLFHKCDTCGRIAEADKVYPFIDHIDASDAMR